ncbi:hypothetical protein [Streptomyces sp. AP-93]|uniref:hypothetical protein n=1 Tax=Streptomyces sp. AP-93 TaxID=2929048 RepID=UPI001FB0403C|nr:hypothetical protein [Streptomyces sp. AP-93]MCJ0875184.1 hypothetical protein [Streptomyces sp. AP-93]
MPELIVPNELFDADLVASDEHSLAARFDWVVQDGRLIHAPVVGWTWTCPECGEFGSLPKDPVTLASRSHGAQQAAGLFNTIVPLLVGVARKFPGSRPGAN